MFRRGLVSALAAGLSLTVVSTLTAQTIGTFRWQLQPYCNVLTLTVTQNGSVYRLEGTDDQCGTGAKASAIGTAFLNPDGSVGLGINIVAAPGAGPVHVTAQISVSTLSGTWHDSSGGTGGFVFTPGAAVPGSPRTVEGTVVPTIVPGSGLTAANAVGSITLSVNFAGSGGALTAARSDHTHGFGTDSTRVGNLALGNATNSTANTAVGARALATLQLAGQINNVAIGTSSLINLTAGGDNIALGAGAGQTLQSGNSNIFIGAPGGVSDNGVIKIGSSQTVTAIAGIRGQTVSSGVPVVIDAAGRLGTTTSSARFKSDIEAIGDVRERVQALRPVRFVYKPEYDDGARSMQYGLIAEEVAETFPELLARDANGTIETVRYHLLIPLLLSEVQRLERELADVRQRLDDKR